MKPLLRRIPAFLMLLAFVVLTGCGGGGGGDGGSDGGTSNTTPVAVASGTVDVTRNTAFSLDGSGSTDADGDTLTYTWTQISGPDVTGGSGSLTGVAPSFTAPTDVSTLGFSLVVNDGQADSTPVNVQINVMEQVGEAVFVDGDNGSDTTGDGSRANPYASISYALANLPAAGYDIYVRTMSVQQYLEFGATTSTTPDDISMTVPEGTSLYGGFSDNWVRDVSGNRTPVWTGSRGIHFTGINQDTWFSGFDLLAENYLSWNETESFAISADSGTATLTIQNNTINSADVNSGAGSSYGLRLANISVVRILDNYIASGNGANGADGQNGMNGNYGGTGSSATSQSGGSGGHYGFCAWGTTGSGGNCTNLAPIGGASASIDGGNGGRGGNPPGVNGGSGYNGFIDGDTFTDANGATGGAGGDFSHQDGYNGNGGPGGGFSTPSTYNGRGGNGGNGFGSIGGGVFVNNSAQNGVRGGHGGGGGGGGGSEGNLTTSGGGGGGGGGGGVGGQGGTAGGSGGASIGILVSNISDVLIDGNSVISANGGSGGAGGNGGQGGNGGNGGSGFVSGDQGGTGGGGGHGGQGGQGGAGGGGPSYSILVGSSMAPNIVNNTLQSGSGGAPGADGAGDNGGARGGRWGNNGRGSDGAGATGYHSSSRGPDGAQAEGGWSYTIYDLNPGDGLVPYVNNNSSTPGAAGVRGQAGEQNF